VARKTTAKYSEQERMEQQQTDQMESPDRKMQREPSKRHLPRQDATLTRMANGTGFATGTGHWSSDAWIDGTAAEWAMTVPGLGAADRDRRAGWRGCRGRRGRAGAWCWPAVIPQPAPD